MNDITARITALVSRLSWGWAYCDAHPHDTRAEELWLALLAEYERAVDDARRRGGYR